MSLESIHALVPLLCVVAAAIAAMVAEAFRTPGEGVPIAPLVIFLALEVLSLSVYVLTGIRRDSPAATEAAFKYFLLGAFASAFFLYGIAFTYGLTGSTKLDRVASLFAAQSMAPGPLHLVAV